MKVSVIICTYLQEAQPYLDLAIKSLEKQVFKDFEVILVSSGPYLPIADSSIIKTHSHSDERLHYPAAMVRGYGLTDPKSEYIFLMNDDCFLQTDCLRALVETSDELTRHGVEAVLNPFSNCDAYGMFYWAGPHYIKNGQPIPLPPKATIVEIKLEAETIMNTMAASNMAIVAPIGFCPFYATLMKRSTYEKVGGIHAQYKTGFDDSDFAVRATKYGVKFCVAFHAACFHFSGVSADIALTTEERAFNEDLFKQRLLTNQ